MPRLTEVFIIKEAPLGTAVNPDEIDQGAADELTIRMEDAGLEPAVTPDFVTLFKRGNDLYAQFNDKNPDIRKAITQGLPKIMKWSKEGEESGWNNASLK